MDKIVVCLIGQDTSEWLDLALESVKDADKIVYIDGGSSDNSVDVARLHNAHIIERQFEREHPGAIGRARQTYLNYVKKNCDGWMCLVIDPDEVVEGFSKLKENLHFFNKTLYSPTMRHLINDFCHEDATKPMHLCLNRLFRIKQCQNYPETEHSVLHSKGEKCYHSVPDLCLWHFGYVKNKLELYNKYKNHKSKSKIHDDKFLDSWYYSHMTNRYPVKEFDINELPKLIKDRFELNKLCEIEYFKGRTSLEPKHLQDAKDWIKYFKTDSVLFLGSGFGQRVFAVNSIFNYKVYDSGCCAEGIEISKLACESPFYDDNIINDTIINLDKIYVKNQVKLIVAYDILEHLSYDELDNVLKQVYETTSKNILISVPVIGDPNLEADSTHKIKQTKEWWINKIESKGFKIIPTPDNFQYKEQIIIGEK